MSETPTERREAAATRRRWVTLAELVAVAGVLIAALSLWQSWSDRRADAADKAATARVEATARARADLVATPRDDGRELLLSDRTHEIADAVLTWPSAFQAAVQHPPGDPVVSAAPITRALLQATDGGADDRSGRVPAMIAVTFVDGDAQRTARGIYDVVWRTQGRFGRGRVLRFEALRLRERGGTQARVDAIWAREKPQPSR
ncbi:hypothetical protein [Sphingomonas sp.]|uniref:hypothetical protein n=1 Tax=Sphingomonas sp. TaxID=28214 RepID=UPI0035BC7BDA